MPTKFIEVYDRALFKMRDYSFLTACSDLKEAVLQHYLLSAIADFQDSCTDIDITDYDLEKEQFNNTLTNHVIEILAIGISYHWLYSKEMDSKLLRNIIHKDDYTSYSPGNLLEKITALKDGVEIRYRGKINEYSVLHGGVATRKV